MFYQSHPASVTYTLERGIENSRTSCCFPSQDWKAHEKAMRNISKQVTQCLMDNKPRALRCIKYTIQQNLFFQKQLQEKKNNTRQQCSHTAENLLHILEEEINKCFPVIEGLPPRRQKGTVVESSRQQLKIYFL